MSDLRTFWTLYFVAIAVILLLAIAAFALAAGATFGIRFAS